ncbi:aminodeoxychorismate lyase [Parashewanella spongiae]|uniref:Aminodeoxychorismate lyase n=1 Tax=Parashewanella spongiae TaxID=342950 RepID=A0A3A6U9X3_9GAMM|nr:aminodeoxychorismate lyase [Parashewanella spongiae]MCL1077350.1 aminodeoxychorismate lyase [Parashewanella spongiae]RJY18317.1 aminodeoxychorismate lyase [Parashewanella spongiae]
MSDTWINGQQGTLVNSSNRGLTYGDGVFATMRIDDGGCIQFFDAHCSRLEQGSQRLKFFDGEDFWKITPSSILLIKQLAKENPNRGIKFLLTRGEGGRGYAPSQNAQYTEIITIFDLPDHYKGWQSQGVSLSISEVKLANQPLLAGIKHLNRLEQVLIKSVLLPDGFDDWLVLDPNNNVAESSMANIFAFIDGVWCTPVMSNCGVSGVMREQVLMALPEMNHPVSVTEISINSLMCAKYVFITNSLFGVVAIKKINQQLFDMWDGVNSLRNSLGVTL